MTDAAEMPEDLIDAAAKICRGLGIASTPTNCFPIIEGLKADRQRDQWHDISTAPDLERVMVSGWQEPSGSVAGYWWWHEDACHGGVALDHPNATHWCNVRLPAFPAAPKGGEA